MGGCSVPGCNSRSDQGVRLFAFPANHERRMKWVENSRRDDWTPTSCSRLCEMHFSEGQFEANRQDGWRKLRPDAVPTIFECSSIFQSSRRPLKRRRSTADVKSASKALACDESGATRFQATRHNSVLRRDLSMKLPPNNSVISSLLQYSVENTATNFSLDSGHSSPNDHARLKVQVETLQAREKIYLSEIRKLKHQLKTLDKILSNTEKNLEKILSLNQIHDIMFGSCDE